MIFSLCISVVEKAQIDCTVIDSYVLVEFVLVFLSQ